ncbi:MAG: Xaa-Pro aminopeptidase [Candidatus Dactylopiibacterium carminicum]|uniref:Xaa-Pro aminopeptidase n=1 Tax=Candidatus Dactylopiibacterium carminicum TaxID=857335 RepID=A0A272EWV7_9RHOO|nr:Xaa-Pro aminopeptidase [Candidatus Dactylopiibacterium carminicum]KAF7600021.1 Xaa-Pro aminopeptidase [Candidatus Dactylopiibacterium carminicum]PAS94589.1 MAG: Xaa-Pro aminopeptidase [Candidatus Dactylopiibacterium carminicum]PAS97628.1 MAG: Xaa-Pro aminopeptidase [Candidatus Dactylopiibacterium carminicum]PAT00026.1 MAG: Xaa-Pro aminopeptidase [Candidatus Dactylopiibacterium carminicum]
MSFNPAPFAARRARLAERLRAAGGGIALIPTAPERPRNRDSDFPYRHDSYFHYLTGFTEPEAWLALVVDADNTRSILFCRAKHEEREIWDGYRFGPAAACEQFGLDEAHTVDTLGEQLPALLGDQPALWYALGHDDTHDKQVMQALNAVRAGVRNGVKAPGTLRDPHAELDEMRLIKDGAELELLRRAAEITAAAHICAMRHARPGMYEYEVEAELLHEFRRSGSQYPAYPSIVASGPNACVLHYVSNDRRMQDGELLLIDAGCEFDSYAGDITRTFPVNGRFEGAARDIYALVLASQKAALAECRLGNTFATPHDTVVRILSQGLIDLGVLKGSLDEVLETTAYRRFYMHRTSHWLGLDVHDAGEYKLSGEWRPLEEGMVLTIEPGCYIRPADDVPEAFWNIGVRIEDDVHVSAAGPEILTSAAPKCIKDVEALMEGD